MKKFIYLILTLAVMSACDKAVENEGYSQDRSLKVSVRAPEGDAVSYPLILYAFQNDLCCGMKTIASSSEALTLDVSEGACDVYVISGASEEDYILPLEDEATPETFITLREGKSHGDLNVAMGSLYVVDGGENTISLTLERKVVHLSKVTILQVPSKATDVRFTVSPVGTAMNLKGITDEEYTTSYSAQLTRQADGRTWVAETESNLLPTTGEVLIKFDITVEGTTKTYSYKCKPLEANHHLSLEATYGAAINVQISAAISAGTWDNDQNWTFEVTEEGAAREGNNDESGETEVTDGVTVVNKTLSVGDIYRNCYVMAVSGKEATLLSPLQGNNIAAYYDTDAQALEKIEAAMSDYSVDGILGWRMMNLQEATLLHDGYASINAVLGEGGIQKLSNAYYMLKDGDDLKKCKFNETLKVTANINEDCILRPVTVVRMK